MRLWFPGIERKTKRPLTTVGLWRALLDQPDPADLMGQRDGQPVPRGHYITQPGDPAQQQAAEYIKLAHDEMIVKRRRLEVVA